MLQKLNNIQDFSIIERMIEKANKREDARDVLVLKEGYSSINDLPNGAKVATGSKRRKYQLLKYRPDLNIVPIRGNVDTRIRKIVDENLDGVVLAASGLLRVGFEDKITYYIPKDIMIPAPAQGARHPLTLAGGCAPGKAVGQNGKHHAIVPQQMAGIPPKLGVQDRKSVV